MGQTERKLHTSSTHAVEVSAVVSPAEVYAGGHLTLTSKVSCAEGCDLSGKALLIMDQENLLVERFDLADFTGEANEASGFVMKAPDTPGTYTLVAVFAAYEEDGVVHEEKTAPLSFTVIPHPTRTSVWGVPSAISAGETFGFKIGVTCLEQCDLGNSEVEIFDHKGAQLTTGRLGRTPWPETTALYYAVVELQAPSTEGHYKWEAKVQNADHEVAHEGCSYTFGVRVVRPAECTVNVEAIDKDDGLPISGAQVVMHPYRTFTDQHGQAVLRIPEGDYRLQVSGFKYTPFWTAVKAVTAAEEVSVKAELSWEPLLEDDELPSSPEVRERLRLQRAAEEKQRLRGRR